MAIQNSRIDLQLIHLLTPTPETQGSPKCRKLITNSKGKRRNISIFSTCQRQTDHEIVGLLSPESLGPQHAHNDEEVAEHRQEDDR